MKARVGTTALVLAFPALVLAGVWFGVDRRLLACGLAVVALARWGSWLGRAGALLAALVLAAFVALSLERPDWALKAYPVCVNLGFLALFGLSLRRGPSLIERLASLRSGPLGPEARRYTRTVTKAWCFFFVGNAALALLTAVAASERVWALYNGAVAYVLMGLMFGGEWLIRRRVQARAARSAAAPVPPPGS